MVHIEVVTHPVAQTHSVAQTHPVAHTRQALGKRSTSNTIPNLSSLFALAYFLSLINTAWA